MWILIIFIYAGTFSKGDSVALTNISGFKTQNACQIAGEKSKQLTDSTFKSARYICVKGE